MSEEEKIINGRYKIEKIIAKGGTSVVYLATDLKTMEKRAVKEMESDYFLTNYRTKLNRKQAINKQRKNMKTDIFPEFFESFYIGDTFYSVMEYIQGKTLKELVYQYGVQPESLVLQWMKELTEGIKFLHTMKPPVLHQDVTPGNIIVCPDGHIKLIDFESAESENTAPDQYTTVLGTKGYAAPERYIGRGDKRSDIYSLGMTMFYLLTEDLPGSRNAEEILHQKNFHLTDGLIRIIVKCIEKNPEKRYQNGEELYFDLNHPQLAGKNIKRQQMKNHRRFRAMFFLSLFLLSGSLFFRYESVKLTQNDYEQLIDRVCDPESYIEAAELCPEKTEAYLKLLEYYEGEGTFGKEESSQFLSLYNSNRGELDSESALTADLNYKAGLMYFNHYGEENTETDFSERIQKAYPFFRENDVNKDKIRDFNKKDLSSAYYLICEFYRKYIFMSYEIEEISHEDIENLLNTIVKTMEEIENEKSYDRLAFYNSVLMLLYDQRNNIAHTGYEKKKVLAVFDKTVSAALPLDVNREASVALKNEIISSASTYRKAIINAYDTGGKE